MKRVVSHVLILSMLIVAAGCAGQSKTKKGAAIGAAAGAVTGALAGKASGHTVVGAIVGAAVGGAAGAYIGHYMDEQAKEIRSDIAGARVERVGEGIRITFKSGILFDVDKAALRPEAETDLDKLSVILNKYNETDILIEGHTDATGSEEHNLDLSRERAQSVANYLASDEVNPTRFTIMGYGESQPVASNASSEGRQANRRVEVAIMANDKLKKVAEKETAG